MGASDQARAQASLALCSRLPATSEVLSPEDIFGRFLAWVSAQGFTLYAHQEQALLELWSGRHVILETPTGSGKSLVALALHWKALCEGKRSFYTAPTKALVSEKFFTLCGQFSSERVGMLTGDASINTQAPIICCTAEVLANMALRLGETLDLSYAVLDEFHYYGDRERGVAWQVPLLCLPATTFLLMSATLGNTAPIAEHLRARSGREVAAVEAEERPVPLEFLYCETPLQRTVEDLLEQQRAPIYIVHFTQRECAEQAQGLFSAKICTREERRVLAEATAETSFHSPYGASVRRFVRSGIGIHHAGLLPRYRLLVEQLAQRGLLKVICGTDTLGVGVNIPIRTVLFSKLCKFDGEKVSLLTAREFKQIAGRAGRKGFDERGFVVCQAPEHMVEKKRAAARERGGHARRLQRRRAPTRNFVPWNRGIFEALIVRPPEPLMSRFRVNHGLLLSVLQRSSQVRGTSGYRAVAELIALCHEPLLQKRRLRREAAQIVRSLHRAGIVRLARGSAHRRPALYIAADLQREFSLHHSLSLYLIDAIWALAPESSTYALDLLSLVEAILENPAEVLRQQERKLKRDLLARLKAEGVPFHERVRRLEAVTYPKPNAKFVYASFTIFAEKHPWLRTENIHPKSIAREMFESCILFESYVRHYELARSEGTLLRYLHQVYGTLQRNVPEAAKNEEVFEMTTFFRALIAGVDSSLLEEWEGRAQSSATRTTSSG